MPTYEYECRECSHRFEHFQSMKDTPLKKCPACGKKKLERLIGAGAGIIFKGSGFYETDYKRKESPSSSSSSSGESSSSSSSASETKGSAPGEGKKGESSSAPKPTSAASE